MTRTIVCLVRMRVRLDVHVVSSRCFVTFPNLDEKTTGFSIPPFKAFQQLPGIPDKDDAVPSFLVRIILQKAAYQYIQQVPVELKWCAILVSEILAQMFHRRVDPKTSFGFRV